MLCVTATANIVGHVLNYCNCWHFKLVKHLYAFDNIHVGKFLWRCYNNSSSKPKFLSQSKLDITSSRGEVNNQVIEGFPLGLTNKLCYQVARHWPPHHRSLVLCCKSIAHSFYTREHNWLDFSRILLISVEMGAFGGDHCWKTWPV